MDDETEEEEDEEEDQNEDDDDGDLWVVFRNTDIKIFGMGFEYLLNTTWLK